MAGRRRAETASARCFDVGIVRPCVVADQPVGRGEKKKRTDARTRVQCVFQRLEAGRVEATRPRFTSLADYWLNSCLYNADEFGTVMEYDVVLL